MFKKIVLAGTLVTVSSFATWDLFPVRENHKGQVKIGASFSTYEFEDRDFGAFDVYAGLRSSIYSGWEIAFNVPYRVFTHEKGYDAEMDGVGNIGFSTRYQFIPFMNAFFDVSLPVGDKSYNEDDDWNFDVGLQYSTQFNALLNFGSQLGFNFATKGENEEAPISMKTAVELDFKIIPEEFTAYVGLDFDLFLGRFTDHGYQYSHDGGGVYLGPYAGVTYNFEQLDMLSVDASLRFGKCINMHDYPDNFLIVNLAFLLDF